MAAAVMNPRGRLVVSQFEVRLWVRKLICFSASGRGQIPLPSLIAI